MMVPLNWIRLCRVRRREMMAWRVENAQRTLPEYQGQRPLAPLK
jgi:hypothetical protein